MSVGEQQREADAGVRGTIEGRLSAYGAISWLFAAVGTAVAVSSWRSGSVPASWIWVLPALWIFGIGYTVFFPLGLRTVLRRTSTGLQARIGVYWIDLDPDDIDFVAIWTSHEWFLRKTSLPVIVMKRDAVPLGKRVQREA